MRLTQFYKRCVSAAVVEWSGRPAYCVIVVELHREGSAPAAYAAGLFMFFIRRYGNYQDTLYLGEIKGLQDVCEA